MIGELATICALWTAFEVGHAPIELDRPPAARRNHHQPNQLAEVRGEGRGGVHVAAQHTHNGERNNG